MSAHIQKIAKDILAMPQSHIDMADQLFGTDFRATCREILRQQDYVLGFLFSAHSKYVVLINKLKPEWQKGKWNGLGGKIEVGETPLQAMHREFKEEAGTFTATWHERLTMTGEEHGEHWTVHVFVGFSRMYKQVRTCEEEEVKIFEVANLPDNLLPSATWLIPFLLDDIDYEVSTV